MLTIESAAVAPSGKVSAAALQITGRNPLRWSTCILYVYIHGAEQFVLLGLSATLRMLVVVHALRGENLIRIISARKATGPEAEQYQSRLR